MWVRSCRRLAATPTRYDAVLKDIASEPVFVLNKQVWCVVEPCGYIIASWHFGRKQCLHLQGYETLNLPITRRKGCYVSSVRREEIVQPGAATTQNSWFHKNRCFLIVRNIFLFVLCVSFIVCCCIIDFLLKNGTIGLFIIFGRQSPRMYKISFKKTREMAILFSIKCCYGIVVLLY